jgi:signal transduction histidine kinase
MNNSSTTPEPPQVCRALVRHSSLMQMVNAQSDVLDRSHGAVESNLREETAADRWLATLAHELRNPLSAVSMALEVIRCCGPDESQFHAAREVARHGVQQMSRIIDDVLELCSSRPSTSNISAQLIDFSTVVSAAINNVGPLVAVRRHSLAVSLPAQPVFVVVHPSRMEQVLTNLLSNAANYTEPGGHISLAVELADGSLVIRVRDNGIGIPPHLLPIIFEPYRRGPTPFSCQRNGLGLGLTIVKSLVELQGGEVSAYSAGPEMGSEFIVEFKRICASVASLT